MSLSEGARNGLFHTDGEYAGESDEEEERDYNAGRTPNTTPTSYPRTSATIDQIGELLEKERVEKLDEAIQLDDDDALNPTFSPNHLIRIKQFEGNLPASLEDSEWLPFFHKQISVAPEKVDRRSHDLDQQQSCPCHCCYYCMIDVQIFPAQSAEGPVLKVINNDTGECMVGGTNRIFLGKLFPNKFGYTVLCYQGVAGPSQEPQADDEEEEAEEAAEEIQIQAVAEAMQAATEGTRASAEGTRGSAEGKRASADRKRASADGKRASADGKRASGEGTQAEAEGIQAEAEEKQPERVSRHSHHQNRYRIRIVTPSNQEPLKFKDLRSVSNFLRKLCLKGFTGYHLPGRDKSICKYLQEEKFNQQLAKMKSLFKSKGKERHRKARESRKNYLLRNLILVPPTEAEMAEANLEVVEEDAADAQISQTPQNKHFLRVPARTTEDGQNNYSFLRLDKHNMGGYTDEKYIKLQLAKTKKKNALIDKLNNLQELKETLGESSKEVKLDREFKRNENGVIMKRMKRLPPLLSKRFDEWMTAKQEINDDLKDNPTPELQ